MTPAARAWLTSGAIVIAASAGAARLRPGLAAQAHAAKEESDVSVLPPPATMKLVSLGYDSALADAIWAKILVDYGTHWHDHRAFPALEQYIDAIVALEPDFETLYKFVDTLLVYRPPRGTEADARRARAYMELGLQVRPTDHDLWLRYGQFLAYIGPSFLSTDADKEAWRAEGARAMVRAVDLGADPDSALSSASLLSRAGERDTEIQSLRTAYALTDDPARREEILARLSMLEDNADQEAAAVTLNRIEAAWRDGFPFLPRTQFLLVGPAPDPLRCAGLAPDDTLRRTCASDWTAWSDGPLSGGR